VNGDVSVALQREAYRFVVCAVVMVLGSTKVSWRRTRTTSERACPVARAAVDPTRSRRMFSKKKKAGFTSRRIQRLGVQPDAKVRIEELGERESGSKHAG
jgi:hypothetical protein